MSELAQRRSARDLWISRSHLRAGGALVIALSASSFLLGYLLGRGRAPDPAAQHRADDDALIELLSRIEANAGPDAASQEMRYSDALRAGTSTVPTEQPGTPEVTQVPAASAWTVVAMEGDAAAARDADQKLRQAGVSAELHDPGAQRSWRVTVGSWSSPGGAETALAVVKAAGFDGQVVPAP